MLKACNVDRNSGMLQTEASSGTNQSENTHKTKTFSFSGILNSLGTIDKLPEFRFRWNSNEEVFTILASFEEHKNWVASEVKIRPPNGSLLLYNKNILKTKSYHNDNYIWKTRKNSKSSARVDHSSLRIRGIECIYCSYVHSALVPTFHRRCYWLLEYPDIVLVHYLNIPDRKTTFDDLVTSLLPHKTLTEKELFCQLQPILTSGEDERNNNTTTLVNVNKLIAEIKNYKKPKTKGKANQKKTSGSNKKVSASTTLQKLAETTPEVSHGLDKCTNCNRYYTTKYPLVSTSSRTNVAVTITRPTCSTSHSKQLERNCYPQVSPTTESSGCNGTASQAPVSTSSMVQDSGQQHFASIPHVTSNQGVVTTSLVGNNHANQMYSCHNVLHGSPYPISSHNSNNTSSNGCHGYASLPVTSEASPSMLDTDVVVLDYDGMNLIQSNETDNDFTKALMSESDINLFENDLLNYLPDYLSDVNEFEPNLQSGPRLMSSDPSITTAPSQVPKVTPKSILNEGPFCSQVMSSHICLPTYSHQGNLIHQSSSDVVLSVGQAIRSPTEMISTDCLTNDNLPPALLNSRATIDGLLSSSHLCSSKDPTVSGKVNVFQVGMPEVNVDEISMSQVNAPKVGTSPVPVNEGGIAQMNVPHFTVPQGKVPSINVSYTDVCRSAARSGTPLVSGSNTLAVTCVSQLGESMTGIPQTRKSKEWVYGVEASAEDVSQMDVSFMRASNVTVNHGSRSQSSLSELSTSVVRMSQLGEGNRDVPSVQSNHEGCLLNVDGNQMSSPTNATTSPVSQNSPQTDSNISKNIITEFSPEWSYCDGNTKVLILGDWSRQNCSYSCLFDGCSVLATLIQPGVLRCFCPPHDPGLVSLQVAWNGFIVSNACVFEYKMRENATNSVSDWFSTSDEDLKKLIIERIERLESILGVVAPSGDSEVDVVAVDKQDEVGTIEDRLVRICEILLRKPEACWLSDTKTGPKGLTLLHLAAGLGYSKLIRFLQEHTRAETSSNLGMEGEGVEVITKAAHISRPPTEWSPHAKDSFGYTPLMWACRRGHRDATMTLLAWQPSSYSDCDQNGRSAKAIAQEMGHVDLVHQMEEFMCGEDMYSLVMEGSPQSPSSSCAYLSVSSNDQVPRSPMSADSLTWERVEGVVEPSPDFEMASVISDDRPNTLGKVLVEIRTLIQQAEEKARSPLNTPSNSAPFSLGFSTFSDLPPDEGTSDNLVKSESEFGPRTPHYDTLSIDSSPIRTPSSHSPGSPAMRNSPQSTGTDTSEFEEFLSKPRQFLEKDFSELTLTDIEQQELLQAAKVIQNAYRQFKIRKKQHIDELKAAVLIQSYYRRYKQFALYRRITKAAVLIQNSYRAHKEHEQFKRSRHAAAVIQTYFRHYRKRKQRHAEEDAPGKRLETKYRKSSYEK